MMRGGMMGGMMEGGGMMRGRAMPGMMQGECPRNPAEKP
jgi:hypothetical protein